MFATPFLMLRKPGIRLALTPTAEGTLLATGSGDFTLTITDAVPVSFEGGPYSIDRAFEGGGLNLNFERVAAAPACPILPAIARTADPDASGTTTIGDTLSFTVGLWLFNGALSVSSYAAEWFFNGAATGVTAVSFVPTEAGVAELRETITVGGVTRTARSNQITVLAPSVTITARPDGIEIITSGSVTVTARPDGILVE